MAQVFISYRTSGARHAAGRMQGGLGSILGSTVVFRAPPGIPPGDDWARTLEREAPTCDIMLVLIDERWLSVKAGRRRRLDLESDWVRREIELALSAGVTLMPVLLDNAEMPTEAKLPEQIRRLASYQSIQLRDATWDDDLVRLARAIEPHLGGSPLRPYSFDYEKDVVRAYSTPGPLDRKYLSDGCPETWPDVERRESDSGRLRDNPVPPEQIGAYR
jgi:hypothetical protein